MSKKNLQAQDLGEYSNYKEKLNELDKIWKIRDLRDRVIENINNQRAKSSGSNDKRREKEQGQGQKGENFGNRPTNQNKRDGKGKEGQIPGKSDNNNSNDNDNNQKIDYSKLTREELINTVNQKDFEISTLKEIIQALERKISELEEEIAELKSENPQTSEIQQEIQKREAYLQEAKNSLEKINALNNEKPNGNTGNDNKSGKFPTGWVIGGGILAMAGLAAALIIKKSKKKR